MSRASQFFAVGEFYHIYNRGVDKRKIFSSSREHERFLTLLYLCNSDSTVQRSDFIKYSFTELLNIKRGEPLVDIGAYCLMPNHFHLLIRERADGGISVFMQKLTTAYTMYFNKLHQRSGALFQGTFKAKHLNDDNYLKYIFAYIHLNPLAEGQELMDLSRYKYSSYLDYSRDGIRSPEYRILNKSAFPKYFQNSATFLSNLADWITHVKV